MVPCVRRDSSVRITLEVYSHRTTRFLSPLFGCTRHTHTHTHTHTQKTRKKKTKRRQRMTTTSSFFCRRRLRRLLCRRGKEIERRRCQNDDDDDRRRKKTKSGRPAARDGGRRRRTPRGGGGGGEGRQPPAVVVAECLRRRQRRRRPLGGVRQIVRRANRANRPKTLTQSIETVDVSGQTWTQREEDRRQTRRGSGERRRRKRTSNRVHPRGRVVRVHVPASLGFAARERVKASQRQASSDTGDFRRRVMDSNTTKSRTWKRC